MNLKLTSGAEQKQKEEIKVKQFGGGNIKKQNIITEKELTLNEQLLIKLDDIFTSTMDMVTTYKQFKDAKRSQRKKFLEEEELKRKILEQDKLNKLNASTKK